MERIAVTVRTAHSGGSGVAIHRDGKTFVLTAAHILHRRGPEDFGPAQVTHNRIRAAKLTSRTFNAQVIKYSHPIHGHDLALLLLTDGHIKAAPRFYTGPVLRPGTLLFHVGTFWPGSHAGSCPLSLTFGILSQSGRHFYGSEYDQTDCPTNGGSSGGAIHLRDGRLVGIVSRGRVNQTLYTPMRRIRQWTRAANARWAVDLELDMPTLAEIAAGTIETPNTEEMRNSETGIRNPKMRNDP